MNCIYVYFYKGIIPYIHYLIQILFPCALERIRNSRDTRIARNA